MWTVFSHIDGRAKFHKQNCSHLVLCNFGFYSERGTITEEAEALNNHLLIWLLKIWPKSLANVKHLLDQLIIGIFRWIQWILTGKTHGIFKKILIYLYNYCLLFGGIGNVKMNVTKKLNLANLEISRFFGLIFVIYEIKFWVLGLIWSQQAYYYWL